MKSIRFILSCAVLFGAFALSAQEVEQIRTVDGSKYGGYIVEQVPGVRMDFHAVVATIRLERQTVRETRDEYYPIELLPEYARDYLSNDPDPLHIKWTTVKTDKGIYEGRLSESGSLMEITVFSPQTYSFPWNQIHETKKFAPDPLWGVKDRVQTLNETLDGYIAEQIPGLSMRFQLDAGPEIGIPLEDIRKVAVVPINPDHDIWEQALFLDRVVLEDGSAIEGLIIERLIDAGKVKIQRVQDNLIESVNAAEIRAYQKFPNDRYVPYQEPEVDTTHFVQMDRQEVELSYLHPDKKDWVISKSSTNLSQQPSLSYIKKGTDVPLVIHNIPVEQTVEVFRVEKKRDQYVIEGGQEADPLQYIELKEQDGDMQAAFKLRKPGFYFLRLGSNKTDNGALLSNGILVQVIDQ